MSAPTGIPSIGSSPAVAVSKSACPPRTFMKSSLIAECLDGPQPGRPTGRVAAEEQPDRDRDAEGQDHRAGYDHRLDPDDRELAADDRGGHPDQPADDGQDRRLDQEL